MKKLYFLPLLFLAITGFAQKQIVVQNGTTQTFNDLNAAIEAANAGDTIYIPGGGYSTPTTIDKTLHWRGVGHYPDSTAATGYTLITSYSVYFTGNCDSSTFEGIYFQHNVQFGSNDDECIGITMKHCRVGGAIFMRSTTDISGGNPDLAFYLTECVTGSLDGRFGMNIRIEKNLIFSIISNFYLSYFNHNTINVYETSSSYDVINSCQNCQFTNNIFGYQYKLRSSENCNFENNIFISTLPYDATTSTFSGSGNIYNTGPNIFTSIATNNSTFEYVNDYHLNASVTGTNEEGTTGISVIGTASDGTNAGVYGTTLPYKEGAVPYAPHIRAANIDNQVVSGNLGVQITVASQER